MKLSTCVVQIGEPCWVQRLVGVDISENALKEATKMLRTHQEQTPIPHTTLFYGSLAALTQQVHIQGCDAVAMVEVKLGIVRG